MAKTKIIEYYNKEVYGLTKSYVLDAELARTIQKLTGRKTLQQGDIEALSELGFTFKLVLKPTSVVTVE